MTYEWTVTKSHKDARSIYIPKTAQRTLTSGNTVTVLVAGDNDFSTEGTLSPQGHLSGMAALYNRLNLNPGTQLRFDTEGQGAAARIIIIEPTAQTTPANTGASVAPALGSPATQAYRTVFQRLAQRHLHFEPFRPQSLYTWDPENETDVYMAFGVLHEYTDYEYCCAASTAVLRRLGIDYKDGSVPDAILIHRVTREYLMAEWKKNSSDFKSNHKPEDVDVLVCWNDNEPDRAKLPPVVVELHSVAKLALAKLPEQEGS